MRAYLDFLRVTYAARLLGGTLLGRLPNGMGMLAVVLHVRAEGGGYTLAGALAAAFGLSMAAGQPILGRAMDRFGQPRVLLPAAWLSAAGFALLALTGADPLPVTVGAVILAGFATPPLEAGLRALWTLVLPGPAQVRAAYALDAAAQEVLFTAGPLLVVAAAAVNTETALLLTGGLGVAGTLVITTSVPSRTWRSEPRTSDWAGPLRPAGIRVLLLALTCAGIALGVYSVAAVAYAERAGDDLASGLLLAAMSAGALAGGLFYGARSWPGSDHRRFLVLMAALAAGYLPLALAPGLPVMTVLAFASGIFLAPMLACSFTLVDRLVPKGTVTEAFAWVVAAFGVGGAIGSAAAGIGQDLAGVSGAFAAAGAGGLLAFLTCLLGIRPLRGDGASGRAARTTSPAPLP
ncbi:MFS transporter [Actinomadura viridis]|uniref:MFS family permease n=1 Tax=Actinomadura viridis TaxID=58110 RepID=A0A931DDD4_9ACTN|nr:MFS transporter [Actinomadura viridis]MBG6087067.1 MFS family permease [Actinomadura viridis]